MLGWLNSAIGNNSYWYNLLAEQIKQGAFEDALLTIKKLDTPDICRDFQSIDAKTIPSLLMLAAFAGHYEIVTKLIISKVYREDDKNEDGNTPLLVALSQCLQQIKDPSACDEKNINDAINFIKIASYLILGGLNVQAVNKQKKDVQFFMGHIAQKIAELSTKELKNASNLADQFSMFSTAAPFAHRLLRDTIATSTEDVALLQLKKIGKEEQLLTANDEIQATRKEIKRQDAEHKKLGKALDMSQEEKGKAQQTIQEAIAELIQKGNAIITTRNEIRAKIDDIGAQRNRRVVLPAPSPTEEPKIIDPNSTLLIDAVCHKKEKVVAELLKMALCDIDAQDAQGNTALLRAVYGIQLLMAEAAQKEPTEVQLLILVQDINKLIVIANQLLDYGANVHLVDNRNGRVDGWIKLINSSLQVFATEMSGTRKILSTQINAEWQKLDDRIQKLTKEEPSYKFIMSEATLKKVVAYKAQLEKRNDTAGVRLQRQLSLLKKPVEALSIDEFISALINTKKPKIFAEVEPLFEWKPIEMDILAAISTLLPVTSYGNAAYGRDRKLTSNLRERGTDNHIIHSSPIPMQLLSFNGILLSKSTDECLDSDVLDVTSDGKYVLNQDRNQAKLEDRLICALYQINDQMQQKNKKVVMNWCIPGSGVFANVTDMSGNGYSLAPDVEKYFNLALQKVLKEHAKQLTQIAAVYLIPYKTGALQEAEQSFEEIKYRVRPMYTASDAVSDKHYQLQLPAAAYNETPNEFDDCEAVSVIAGDLVSWIFNDAYRGSNGTNDGAHGYDCDGMSVLTGVPGRYEYENVDAPPRWIPNVPYGSSNRHAWHHIAEKHKLTAVASNIFVFDETQKRTVTLDSTSGEALLEKAKTSRQISPQTR